ncbi:aldehyde dehydrogenase family protein [Pedobacter endophyticus]|uniref:Aldehyde dehydrogenase family protein n=1 Tax=Pedobacter endophyticus TaxID=2789740 RepID=A0A7U3SPR8_9SPHI|nr:aldehyde dehydrogenase family protein [Pedobacter endophyticus]QPH38783.1 aldehyde dehydrogenase family protein [Pedobacter endophyticus]
MQIINPATEEVIAHLEEDRQPALNAKFKLLKQAQPIWAEKSLSERINIISTFSGFLEAEIERLAATLTSEVGKPLQQARNEINGARSRIKWMLSHAEKYLSDEIMVEEPGLKEIIKYEPLGVVCNISAWNYPYLVGVNVFIPALLNGNAVMYKPSEHATLTGLEIEKLLKKAGVPDEIFQVAIGGGQTGAELLKLDFDGYFFTGSYKTGKLIYEAVATKMVPCQLELGGKDPLYIAEDVSDVENAAMATADGAFYNNGQSCCSVERIYVHKQQYDAYLSAFVKEVQSWKVGSPTDSDTYLGALTRKEQIGVLQNQVSDALAKGAKLLHGGKPIANKGYFFEPTVLSEVTNDMLVMQEESFGPIIGIMKVENDEEALKMMQDTNYGLTASIYTADQKRAESLLSKLDAGSGYWNCCDRVSAALPWSGRKYSGIGATLSHQGLRAFSKPKAYHLRG